MNYECNEFKDEDMEVFNMDFSDLQFSYTISKIVYTDMSVVEVINHVPPHTTSQTNTQHTINNKVVHD